MNILHVIGGDLSGGAARGAYWLHQGLLAHGVDSHVLTSSKETYGDKTVTTVSADKKGQLATIIRAQLDAGLLRMYRNRQRVIFSTGLLGYDFSRTKIYKQADIVHLHWICGGMVNMGHLAKIKKPMIWTMRDMWPMTGGCHYSMGCMGYMSGCGSCPQLRSTRQKDLSRLVFWRKKRHLPPNMKLVGISHWLSDCARQSALFQDFDVRTIHNNFSSQEFFPIDKSVARQMLGVPANKPIVLAGAQDMRSFYKGFDIFLQAEQSLDADVMLLFFGKLDQTATNSLKHDFISLGFLHDSISLRLAYSAADLFVAPSKMDAFGKTLAEAMACGTPVVCFDATGPREIVDHQVNGYKAESFDPRELSKGIDWVLNYPEPEKLSKAAREKVIREFDSHVVAGRYVQLYEEVLEMQI